MVRLRDSNKSFDLDVLGYEFPDSVFYEDANWLIVKIYASDEIYSWEAKDSCLLTSELKELKNWLKSIYDGQPVKKIISFEEGEISFSYNFNDDFLDIRLNFIFHPKGDHYIYGENGDKKYSITFPLHRNLPGLIKSIDLFLTKYPERKGKRL